MIYYSNIFSVVTHCKILPQPYNRQSIEMHTPSDKPQGYWQVDGSQSKWFGAGVSHG